jgi:hypothetical protein
VVLYPDELGWLREAPTLNAVNDNPDGDEDHELDPLRQPGAQETEGKGCFLTADP